MKIAGRAAVVVGGASGMAKATAEMLVREGAQVSILDLPRSRGAEVAKELGGSFHACDVTDFEGTEAALSAACDELGALHFVCNTAGGGIAVRTLGKSGPHPLDAFRRVVDLNLVATFNVARLAAARMSRNEPDENGERGVIINTASIAAFDGQIGQAAYSASKGGVVGLTLPVARDLASVGIRVCTIAPGTFDTPMLALLPENARKALGAQIPFPSRLGRPNEYAALARHIVENAMLNGETIRLDGALRMAPR